MTGHPIDIDALLAPIDGSDGGAGQDLRDDYSPSSPYQRLRDARAAARAEERARDADGDTEAPVADGWRDVARIGVEALGSRTKDLEIASWLTEALVRQHGLDGLSAGATLIRGLCDSYWDWAFPLPDDEGLDGRAAPIGGLAGAGVDGTVMQPLRRLPLFRRADGSPLGLYQWDQAEETDGIANEERRQARRDAGVPELATLEAEARMDRAFLSGVAQSAEAALEAWRAMAEVTENRFGAEAPSTRNVVTVVERIIAVTRRLLGPETATPAAAAEDSVAAPAIGGGAAPVSTAAAAGAAGPIRTREDALRELGRIADFFRATEPHSPLAYTLEEAVRRGRMTLPELLAEIIPDEEARFGMLSRLGIRPESTQ
ncbi:type VI secretion system protein TssA [Roseomonas stagni]|uniref:Type VI secretion system protein TssA n=1 Tax=Falsiroseomonas algicola TaxID=2716930 RepID=A0A6M1LIL2_9PROT|nr:type VI secretion system protein TssA [Falsiroseomonas algicola]NGM19849.1 type VI secretion system protein TssA [Falsiroseomonas algicola]